MATRRRPPLTPGDRVRYLKDWARNNDLPLRRRGTVSGLVRLGGGQFAAAVQWDDGGSSTTHTDALRRVRKEEESCTSGT